MLTSIVAGLAAGGAYALLGVCLVFTYRLVSVVNFTGAAIGATGTFAMVMSLEVGVNLPLAMMVGLAVGTFTAALLGAVMMKWFSGAPPQTKAAVTVALLVGMVALGLRLTGGQHPRPFPDLVPGAAFTFAGVVITRAALVTITLALLFTIAATASSGFAVPRLPLGQWPHSASLDISSKPERVAKCARLGVFVHTTALFKIDR